MSPSRPDLVLYKRDDCPFCQKVAAKLQSMGMHLAQVDLNAEAGARARLVELGGRAQVPCLVIDGKPMYESEAIISYLDTLTARS